MSRRYALASVFACALLAVPALAIERPLTFEPNRGQFADGVLYAARGPQYSVVIDRRGASLRLDAATLRLEMIGARADARITAVDELRAKTSYFLGSSRDAWKTRIPNFARVQHDDVYDGIDAVYYGNGSRLEYDLIVHPGSDPSRIAMRFRGADRVSLDREGRLHLRMGEREVIQEAPVVYQEIDGVRRSVAGRYALSGSRVKFRIAKYDRTRPLVIDPVLVYSTYFGASSSEAYTRSAVDAAGNHFVATYVTANDLPLVNPMQTHAGVGDVGLTKFSPDGQTLLFSTYFGGSSWDYPRGVATDFAGNVYITGWTESTDLPTMNPAQASLAGGSGDDLYVAKISADGQTLMYSTYWGGTDAEFGTFQGLTVDSLGQAVVVGSYSASLDFPTVNAFQPALNGPTDGVAFKLDANGAVIWSTYFGGSGIDNGFGVAADLLGNSYLVGNTSAPDFPTFNALQPTLNGISDSYIIKLDPTGNLIYSTFFGGSGADGFGNAVTDALGNLYLAGGTSSTDYPITAGAYQTACAGATCSDVVVTKLDSTGTSILYSTYIGGTGSDGAIDIDVDLLGRATILGSTISPDYPLVSAVQTFCGNCPATTDAIISRLSPLGDALDFSTYFGGSIKTPASVAAYETADNLSLDLAGNIYVSGTTRTINFPLLNALYTAPNGDLDAWVAKFGEVVIITPSPAVLNAQGGANHKLVDVTLAYDDGSSSSRITTHSSPCSVAVSSNEPVNGTGDGDTSPDWVIVDPHHVKLRAERAGNGNGRVYTISVTCPHAAGSGEVKVPKGK